MSLDHVSEKNIEELDSEIEVENTRKIEAALFIAGRFLSIHELVSLTDVNPLILKKILSDLKDKYKTAGITVIQKDNSWKMDVAQELVWMVNRLATGSSEFSKAEQETLALIAYKQPMKQSVVIKIRGNKAYEHIKKFVELGLLNKKKTGHTAEITLAESFYDYFHVNQPSENVGRERAFDELKESAAQENEDSSILSKGEKINDDVKLG